MPTAERLRTSPPPLVSDAGPSGGHSRGTGRWMSNRPAWLTSGPSGHLAEQVAKRQRAHTPIQREGVLSRMDDGQRVQVEVAQCRAHGRRHAGRGRALDLESQPAPPLHDQQVELRPGVRAPEETLLRARAQAPDDLLEHEPLPGRANLRVREQLVAAPQAQKRVQDPRVRDVDAGRLDLPLADVRVPGRQQANRKGAHQLVEVTAYRGVRDSEG